MLRSKKKFIKMKLSTEKGGANTLLHPRGLRGLGLPRSAFLRWGQWERGQDYLIKVIPFLLYLFRTCHLVVTAQGMAPGMAPLADSHFGSLSKVTLNPSLASQSHVAHGQCPPCLGHHLRQKGLSRAP